MIFKAKSIKMQGKRQRTDADRGLTYLQRNTDKGTQQIIQGEDGVGKNCLANQKVVHEAKHVLKCVRACHVRHQHPALPCSLSRGSLERQSKSGGHRDRPSRV